MLKIIFLLIQEDYPETRRTVKKLKTTHVNYQPSGQKQEIRPYVDKKPEEKIIQVTNRGEDLTYGRIETSRTLPSTYRREEPKEVERITVEEITFPRKTKSTSAETYQVRVSRHIHSATCLQQVEGKPPIGENSVLTLYRACRPKSVCLYAGSLQFTNSLQTTRFSQFLLKNDVYSQNL